MKTFSFIAIVIAALISTFGISALFHKNQEKDPVLPQGFDQYWYAGKAEISGFSLEQARYREIHKGTAALIFVTENFSLKRQVKSDNPDEKNRIPVLKLNFTRKFITGIYPYSTMISAFTPVNYLKNPHTLKINSSVQEWCGQVFEQLNLSGDKYKRTSFSYFENEGDENTAFEKAITEDELWSRIRINPAVLPTGIQTLIPGLTASRLGHFAAEPQPAILTLGKTIWEKDSAAVYHIQYQKIPRKLSIYFNPVFPYDILGWEEVIQDLDGQNRTTKARRNNLILSDYWTLNNNADRPKRKELGLPEDNQ
ncbi:MAG: hypothetical protein K1X92_09660 [Bacteroidia bacterium]|nr:hypothetical protein [Bacteroidia bacterium]